MDAKKLSGIIKQLYECALSGDWLDALNLIRDETQSNKVFFMVRDVERNRVVDTHLVSNIEYESSVLSGFLKSFNEDPWLAHSQGALEGEITRPSVDVPVETFATSSIYQKCFLPLETHYGVGVIVIRDEQYESFLICNRGKEDNEYSQDDIELIEPLLPHLRQAVRIYLTLQTYKKVLSISQAINKTTEAGVVLCNEDCEILETNEFAKDILEKSGIFAEESNKLTLKNVPMNQKLRAHVKQCAHFNDNRMVFKHDLYVENNKQQAFLLSVLPLTRVDGYIHTQYAAVVKINSQKQIRWQAIQHEYELTPKELFVTELIFDKYTTQQIAEELIITVNTARTHIQNVYKKLEVNSQVELMAKLSLYAR